jgi:uncharacterized membrane protein
MSFSKRESYTKEGTMVEPTKDKEGTTTTKGKTGKRKWLDRFVTFLSMGGFILIIFLIVAIWIAISILTKGC